MLNEFSLGLIEESVKCIGEVQGPLGEAVKEKCTVY